MQASQSSRAAETDAEHSNAIEQLLTIQEEKLSNLRADLESTNQAKIEELQKTHDAALAEVHAQLAEAHAAAQDVSILESLKLTIADLEKKLNEAEQSAAESKELAGKHNADLSTILTEKNELEQQHQAVTNQVAELEKSLAASESAKSELEAVLHQLAASKDELSQLKSQHETITGELQACKTENRAMEERLEQGERDLNSQIDKNMSLLNQLGEVDSSIAANRKRVRELEAEVAALKAEKDTHGGSTGLEGSRWAGEKEEAAEGEDLGSSIQGTVGLPRLFPNFPRLT